MSEKMRRRTEKVFTDQDLVVAAGIVRQSMLDALPEPEACTHEFSAQFQEKMKRLFAKDRTLNAFATIRRFAAAVILL
ncbi:MAG: hypothetical protein IJA58_06575, partial [Lachnospiraceae bacterium]|nr:hypothetical protein [Lachnospiraceae bacterium]